MWRAERVLSRSNRWPNAPQPRARSQHGYSPHGQLLNKGSGTLSKNNGLHQRMHGSWLTRQTALETSLQAVREHAKRLSVSRAHPVDRGCKRRHKDRPEEQSVFLCKGLLVSVLFVV